MLNRRQFLQRSTVSLAVYQLMACGMTQKTPGLEQLFDSSRKPGSDRPSLKQRPTFLANEYGAKGNGVALDTEAIQRAIDAAHSHQEGGKVVLSNGRFLSGTLTIKSNVELHIAKDAALIGSTDVYQYGRSARGWLTLLRAHNAKNIALTGSGTIDGQGRETALAIDYKHHSGERPMANYNKRRMRPNEAERPEIIDFVQCSDVYIYDIKLEDAASWVQTYDRCRNLHIDNIKVVSDSYWNNDGIDIENCHDVRITNCFVNSADDAICLKSVEPHEKNENVYIGNCIVRSSSNGVKFGTSSAGGFKHIQIENIRVFDTYRSAICLGSVDGGDLEDVDINNIEAKNTGNGFVLRLGHRNKKGQVGTLKNVSIRNLKAEIPFGRADIDYDLRGPALNKFFNPVPASITGLPGHHVENVTLENIDISYPGIANKGLAYIPTDQLFQVPQERDEYPEYTMFGELPAWGLYVRHVNGLTMRNITFRDRDADFRPAYVFDDVRNLKLFDSNIVTNQAHPQIVMHDVQKADLVQNRYQNGLAVSSIISGNSHEISEQ